MEFQVDSFASNEEANAFIERAHFAVNLIGVEYYPEATPRPALGPAKAKLRCCGAPSTFRYPESRFNVRADAPHRTDS